jgi:hypothetical protein
MGRLPFGWCGKHLGLVVNELFSDGNPKEFNITITVEAPGQRAGSTAQESDYRKNRVRQKVYLSKCPVYLVAWLTKMRA